VTQLITVANGTISKSFRKYRSKIAEKGRHQGTTENSHTGHCTHNLESNNVKVQNIQHGKNNIICAIIYNYRITAKI
jgi:hypothetical protein